MSNRLIHETSPYLLQHAHNPVDWYPWGEEALEKARSEDKPMLLSIGYSACHWCHVMEKESFEDHETAALMNENFVNIKIDREERPDLDHIYMDAVQTMTGSGGWPLNVFLTPAAKPFYGGTYFPPRRAFNRSSWKEVLQAVAQAFREKRPEVEGQADDLTQHLLQANLLQVNKNQGAIFTKEKIDETYNALMKSADTRMGGFGAAPKFPQTFSIQFLLRYHYISGDGEALKQAALTLDKMIQGGIYDQLGGGFARYATDDQWLVPHFEKMLYDNALIAAVLCEAYQLTRSRRYADVIHETIEFVRRELMSEQGGFSAALDADSEGEEGKFYLWEYRELEQLLGQDSVLFCDFFGVTENGNFNLPGHESLQVKNILHVRKPLEIFASEKNLRADQVSEIIQSCKLKLLKERERRVRPTLDDKKILGWNALMNAACSKAFEATGEESYRKMAIQNMEFLLANFQHGADGQFYHSWKNKSAKNPAFLDDYAFLVHALLQLQQVSGNVDWLHRARGIAEYVIKNFSNEQTDLFFFTDIKQQDLIVRKVEMYDGATPSGNAVMAYNLLHLAILFDIPAWRQRAEKMLGAIGEVTARYPSSFGMWANLLMEMVYGTNEIVVVGKDPDKLAGEVLAQYIPHKVFMKSAMGHENFPMLSRKEQKELSLIHLCHAYSCLKPVSRVNDLLELLGTSNKNC